ncbi:MAG: hypothetical protein QUS09_08655, partial [Methanotrichaceae archaeon]|nr:hypothetical protein [Methanotrichaceae archaeon]
DGSAAGAAYLSLDPDSCRNPNSQFRLAQVSCAMIAEQLPFDPDCCFDCPTDLPLGPDGGDQSGIETLLACYERIDAAGYLVFFLYSCPDGYLPGSVASDIVAVM